MSKIMSDEPLGENPGPDSLVQPGSSNKPVPPWSVGYDALYEGESAGSATKYSRQDVPELNPDELALHERVGIIPVVPSVYEVRDGAPSLAVLQQRRAEAIWRTRLAKQAQGGYLWRAAIYDMWQVAPPRPNGITTTESLKRPKSLKCSRCGDTPGLYETRSDGSLVCAAGCAS